MATILKCQEQVSCPPFRNANNRYHGHYYEMSTTGIMPTLSKLPNISKCQQRLSCPPFLKSSHIIYSRHHAHPFKTQKSKNIGSGKREG
jgi:hypothetical protein